jgi:hypothetical protein
VGHHAQGGVVMEASPCPVFEVVQPYLALEFLVVALHPPAQHVRCPHSECNNQSRGGPIHEAGRTPTSWRYPPGAVRRALSTRGRAGAIRRARHRGRAGAIRLELSAARSAPSRAGAVRRARHRTELALSAALSAGQSWRYPPGELSAAHATGQSWSCPPRAPPGPSWSRPRRPSWIGQPRSSGPSCAPGRAPMGQSWGTGCEPPGRAGAIRRAPGLSRPVAPGIVLRWRRWWRRWWRRGWCPGGAGGSPAEVPSERRAHSTMPSRTTAPRPPSAPPALPLLARLHA